MTAKVKHVPAARWLTTAVYWILVTALGMSLVGLVLAVFGVFYPVLLVALGVPEAAVRTRCAETIPEDRAADMILKEARAHDCGTIVVGRNSLPWLREMFHRHVGQDLAKAAERFSILIVE